MIRIMNALLKFGLRVLRKIGRILCDIGHDIKTMWGRCVGTPYTKEELDLVIFDDFFPSPLTLFRVLEFEKYMNKWPKTAVFSAALEYDNFFSQYKSISNNAHKIHRFRYEAVRAKCAYFMFVHNARTFLRFIELNKIPFVFTLYPGGDFWLDHAGCDKTLRRIFKSSCFHKVIVTQNITEEYLLRKGFCTEKDIVRVPGSPYKVEGKIPRKEDRETLDVAFCAAKYMPQGIDKGYDLFIETCKILACKIPNLKVHIIGNYDAYDVDIHGIECIVSFYGLQPMQRLREIFSGIDIILSPNRANILHKGAFDGFPTGSVGIAAMEGAAMFVADELGQNELYTLGEQIEIVDHNPENIAAKIIEYAGNPQKLRKLQIEGQKRVLALIEDDVQMPPRYQVLEEVISLR